jgi:hypothetical protein
MCYFITLIAPSDDMATIGAIMKRHGRAATLIENHSLRKVMRENERQYLTTRSHCDCGTVLALNHNPAEKFEIELVKEQARLKRKGWSAAKIARALDDLRKSDAKPKHLSPDSLELWDAALHELVGAMKLAYAGLFVRSYSGAIDTEAFIASRRDVPKDAPWLAALATLNDNEITIFR